MGRQVPAVERALEILELLADHPREILGLSEIARTLTMNKASCHATLTLLADRGYLIRHAGQVVTRHQILDAVWGSEPDVYSNVVDLYVHYLRRKLAELDRADWLRTVRGVGYTLRPGS